MSHRLLPPTSAGRQQGVAAIEFALMVGILLLVVARTVFSRLSGFFEDFI